MVLRHWYCPTAYLMTAKAQTWCSPLCTLSRHLSGCAGDTALASPASNNLGTRGTFLTAQTWSASPLVPGGWTCTEQNSKPPSDEKETKDQENVKWVCPHEFFSTDTCLSQLWEMWLFGACCSFSYCWRSGHELDMFVTDLLDVGLFKWWTSEGSLYNWLAHLQDAFPQ